MELGSRPGGSGCLVAVACPRFRWTGTVRHSRSGVLTSKRLPQPVVELHGETPPFAGARVYLTMSWTDESAEPTFITAVEHPVLHVGRAFRGIGSGFLWLEAKGYRPYPILVSSTCFAVAGPAYVLCLDWVGAAISGV